MLCVIWAGSRMWCRARARVIVANVTLRQPVRTPEGDFSHSGGRAGVSKLGDYLCKVLAG